MLNGTKLHISIFSGPLNGQIEHIRLFKYFYNIPQRYYTKLSTHVVYLNILFKCCLLFGQPPKQLTGACCH